MTFLLAFWKPIAAIVAMLALAAFVIVAKHRYDEARRTEGRAEIQAKWDADSQRRIAAATALTLMWNDKRIAAEKAEQERDDERRKRTELASERARTLPASVAAIRVPVESVRVLNDAIRASDKPETTGPAREPAKEAAATADSTVGLLTQWGVSCIAAYDEARGMVEGWQDFYQSLRTGN